MRSHDLGRQLQVRVPGQGMEGLARMMVRTPGKKTETHEPAELSKNYGADISTLTELIESGKL